MAARALSPHRLRPDLGDRRGRDASDRPPDADDRLPPRRRARGRRPGARAPRGDGRALRRGQRGRSGADPPLRVPGPAPSLRSMDPGRHARRDEAARLRPLDQLGARADARRDGARARARADREARPDLSDRPPDRDPARRRLQGPGPGAGRADRPGAGDARPRGRGDRLEQLGDQRRALGVGRADARRRPAPPPEHARHLVPGGPAPGRPGGARRDSARHPRHLHGLQRRRRLDLHQRHGRRRGPLHRAHRGRPLRASGRVASSSRR